MVDGALFSSLAFFYDLNLTLTCLLKSPCLGPVCVDWARSGILFDTPIRWWLHPYPAVRNRPTRTTAPLQHRGASTRTCQNRQVAAPAGTCFRVQGRFSNFHRSASSQLQFPKQTTSTSTAGGGAGATGSGGGVGDGDLDADADSDGDCDGDANDDANYIMIMTMRRRKTRRRMMRMRMMVIMMMMMMMMMMSRMIMMMMMMRRRNVPLQRPQALMRTCPLLVPAHGCMHLPKHAFALQPVLCCI